VEYLVCISFAGRQEGKASSSWDLVKNVSLGMFFSLMISEILDGSNPSLFGRSSQDYLHFARFTLKSKGFINSYSFVSA